MAEQILNYGRSLKEFQSQEHRDVFEEAEILPQFFASNLVDDARVIKVFYDDPQGSIRVFYYQYLKLCFEFDNPNYEFYINKVHQLLLNPEFSFNFPTKRDSLMEDRQYKRFFLEFFEYMSQGGSTVNQALSRFPIADMVLVCFFRTVVMLAGKADSFDSYVDRDTLFQFLTSYFNVDATVHENCMKFVETDIFCYEERPDEIYLIYIDYEKGMEGRSMTQSRGQLNESNEVSYQQNSPNVGQFDQMQWGSKVAESREVLPNTEVAIQESKNVLSNKNDEGSQNLNPDQKKRKQMLSYMGSSDIYDFVDYTSPRNIEVKKTVTTYDDTKLSTLSANINNATESKEYFTESMNIPSELPSPTVPENLSKKSTKINELTKLISTEKAPSSEDQSPLNTQAKEKSAISSSSITQEKKREEISVTFNPKQEVNEEQKGYNFIMGNTDKPFSPNIISVSNPGSKPSSPFTNIAETLYSEVSVKSQYPSASFGQNAYQMNDKYGLDTIKVDPTKFGGSGVEIFKSENIKSSYTNTVSNAYTNSILPDFPNESFEEKMKRIAGESSQAYKSSSQASSITNEAYLTQSKNKTASYESSMSYQNNQYSPLPTEKPKSHHVSYTGRNNTVDPDTEFTNSFTLEEVQQPYRSNIRSIKVRARAARKTVGQSYIY